MRGAAMPAKSLSPHSRLSGLAALAPLLMVALAAGAGCGRHKPTDISVGQQALGEPQWAPGQTYQIGTRVTYAGVVYEARQTHTSQSPFPPPGHVTLWFKPTPTGIA